MKKKLSMLLVGLFGIMFFPSITNAAVQFNLTCTPDQPNYGDTVNCQVTLVQSTNPITQLRMKTTSYNMEVQGTTYAIGATDPWNNPVPDATTGYTTLTSKTAAGVSSGKIADIVAKVAEQGDDCGNICVEIYYTEFGATGEKSEKPQLYDQKVCEKGSTTPTDPKFETPDTGNFASYAILAGGAAIALATISIAKRSTKFYKV